MTCALIWFLNFSPYADSAEIFSHPVDKLFWWSEVWRISLWLWNCPETITGCYATIPPSDGTQKTERCRVCYVSVRIASLPWFWWYACDIFLFSRLNEAFTRMCLVIVVTLCLMLFISSFMEVSGFKCSNTNLRGFWDGIKTCHSAFSKNCLYNSLLLLYHKFGEVLIYDSWFMIHDQSLVVSF